MSLSIFCRRQNLARHQHLSVRQLPPKSSPGRVVRAAALPHADWWSADDDVLDDSIQDLSSVRLKSRERPVIQWYPGHIAKAERQLKEQISKVRSRNQNACGDYRDAISMYGYLQVDIVFEVRDARIINTTKHPLLDEWTHNKAVFLVINRVDMVSKKDLAAWEAYFQGTRHNVFFTNGQRGHGIERVTIAAEDMSDVINASRIRRGLKPRPVRACVLGFPNIGKSAIINRLLNRRVVESAATPGVTRSLRWIRMGERLDLLDAPGIIPMSLGTMLLQVLCSRTLEMPSLRVQPRMMFPSKNALCTGDQRAAERLAMCNDIADTAYVQSSVAAAYIDLLKTLPDSSKILDRVHERYGIRVRDGTSEDFVSRLGHKLFLGCKERAGQRLLKDYRDCRLGPFALEHPPKLRQT
jgi:hypothetical protein